MRIKISKSSLRRQGCRMCGFHGQHMRDIFDNASIVGNSGPHELTEELFRFAGVRVSVLVFRGANESFLLVPFLDNFQVRSFDRLTTKICQTCYDEMNEIARSRRLCLPTNTNISNFIGIPIDFEDASADEVTDLYDADPRINVDGPTINDDFQFDGTTSYVFLTSIGCLEIYFSNFIFFLRDHRLPLRRLAAIHSIQAPVSRDNLSRAVAERAENTEDSWNDSYSSHFEEESHLAKSPSDREMSNDSTANNAQMGSSTFQKYFSEQRPDPAEICISPTEDISEVEMGSVLDKEKVNEKPSARNKRKFMGKSAKTARCSVVECDNSRCMMLFESANAENYHVANDHASDIVRTNKKALPAHKLRKHKNCHTTTSNIGFRCLITTCPKIFTRKSSMKRHMDGAHPHIKKTTEECEFCSYQSNHNHKHLKSKHFKSTRCKLCEEMLQPEETHEQHINSAHNGIHAVHCTIPSCSKTFRCRAGLRLHLNAKHTQKMLYNCTNCSHVTFYRSNLSKHFVRMHGKSSSETVSIRTD